MVEEHTHQITNFVPLDVLTATLMRFMDPGANVEGVLYLHESHLKSKIVLRTDAASDRALIALGQDVEIVENQEALRSSKIPSQWEL